MKKKILSLLLTIVMLTGILGTSVSAADYDDHEFQFYVYSGILNETPERLKYDTSNTYVNILEINYDRAVKCILMGQVPQSSGTYTWQNITASSSYALLSVGQWEVRSSRVAANLWIKLRFEEYLSDTGLLGEWSPDCAGSYTVAN